MSITASYMRLSLERWQALSEASQEDFNDFEISLFGTSAMMELSGDFQAIHFLLTGYIAYISDEKVRPVTSAPLESVVMGGVDTQFTSVYGYVRYLSPETVKMCSLALNQVTEAHYAERLTGDAFNQAGIYPYPVLVWDEDELEILPDVLDNLKFFFTTACEENQIILIDL